MDTSGMLLLPLLVYFLREEFLVLQYQIEIGLQKYVNNISCVIITI